MDYYEYFVWNLFSVSKNAVNTQLFLMRVCRKTCVFENFQFHFFSYTLRRMCKSSEFLIKITTLCSFPKEIFFLIMVQEMPNKVLLYGVVREWWILYVILSFWVWHNFTCCHGLIMILSIFFLNIYNFSKVKPNDVNEGKFSREAITQDNNWKQEAYWYIFKNRNKCVIAKFL